MDKQYHFPFGTFCDAREIVAFMLADGHFARIGKRRGMPTVRTDEAGRVRMRELGLGEVPEEVTR
jgi:hypothetical protein